MWNSVTAFTPTPYFKRDAQLRARLFDPRSFQHDAKANLNLLAYLVDRYTLPGDRVLDPMAGTGSLFLASSVGNRRVICGEIEDWLMPIIGSNLRRHGNWSYHWPGAYRGDAAKLPLADGSVDACLFSPPYWDTFSDWHVTSRRLKNKHRGPHGSAYADERGSKIKRNAGNEHVYEHYLRAMFPIYVECRRVLKPGGRMVLIVKDKIHGGQRVPLVDDTVTMLKALGFGSGGVLTRQAPLTQYRNLHKAHGLPVIEDEQVIVAFKYPENPRPTDLPFEYTLIMPPDVDYGPPQQVYRWMLELADRAGLPLLLNPSGEKTPVAHWPTPPATLPDPWARSKFTQRRRCAFLAAEHLVINHGLRAGDRVTLFVPWRYAAYLERRLNTFGAVVDVPTKGLNMGQKMTWFRKALG